MRKIGLTVLAFIALIAGCDNAAREAIVIEKRVDTHTCRIDLETRYFGSLETEVMTKEECNQFQEGELITFNYLGFGLKTVRIHKKKKPIPIFIQSDKQR